MQTSPAVEQLRRKQMTNFYFLLKYFNLSWLHQIFVNLQRNCFVEMNVNAGELVKDIGGFSELGSSFPSCWKQLSVLCHEENK